MKTGRSTWKTGTPKSSLSDHIISRMCNNLNDIMTKSGKKAFKPGKVNVSTEVFVAR